MFYKLLLTSIQKPSIINEKGGKGNETGGNIGEYTKTLLKLYSTA